MPNSSLLIRGARFLVTMDSERRLITDGAVLIEGQRITRVGKTAELTGVDADRIFDAQGMVVTPGFINGHMHISYAHAVRGLFPDDLGPSYLPHVFRLQGAMTAEEEYWTSLLAITELVKYGTTCFLDPGTTKYLDRCLEAYRLSGCRIITGSHVTDRPNPLNLPVAATEDAIRTIESTIRTYHNALDGRVEVWAMPFSPQYCSLELLTAAKDLADEYQTGLTTHHNYSHQAMSEWLAHHQARPAQYLEDIGVLGANVTLAHALGVDQAEVESLARTGCRVIVCPTAALKGASGMTQNGLLPEMLDLGVPVGLGTDAGNNSNLLETLRSVYLVAVVYKDARQDWRMVPAEKALEMGTIDGAKALGLDGEIGSIEVGKKADLVLFDTKRPEWGSLFNPVNSLVYNADGRSVHTVIVDGEVVVEDHRPLFVDELELVHRVQSLGEGLLRRENLSFPPRWPVV